MKTNLVKKGSEKCIELFQISNEELATINGGKMEMYQDENGNWIFITKPNTKFSFFNSFFHHD